MTYLVDDDTLSASLNGSHKAKWTCDVFYAGVPTLTDLPILNTGTFSVDGSANIQGTARIYVASDQPILDRAGTPLAPNDVDDLLAPYGQEIVLKRQISLGSRAFPPVVMGTLRIAEVPTIQQTRRRLRGSTFLDSVYLELSLKDRFDKIDGDQFSEPSSPTSGATVWAEIQRISTVPVQSAVNDAPVSSTYVYDGGKIPAITDLLTTIGAVPYMTRQGILTALPAAPMSGAYSITDLTGQIVDQSNSLSNAIRNRVVVTGSGTGSSQLVGVAQIESGALSVYGEMGARVRTETFALATTQGAVDAAAKTYLAQELATQSKVVTVNALVNLALEIGDVAKATDPASGRVEIGVVSKIDYSLDPKALASVQLTIPQGV
jgi:hypothetical protein